MVTSPLLIIVAFLLIGCAHAPLKRDQPPLSVTLRWNLSDTNSPPLIANDDPPHSIVIRWASLVTSAADVERLAERHCLAWNRYARRISERVNGDARIAEFICDNPAGAVTK